MTHTMTDRSVLQLKPARLAACIVAAGLLFMTGASAQTTLPPPAYGDADARQDRIEQLERELVDATAENERLQHQLNQAQREITRLRAMVGDLASVNQDLQTGQTPPADGSSAAPPSTPPAAPPQQQRSGPAQQGTLGTLSADQLPGDAGAAYTHARQFLIENRLAEAEVAFGQFLQAFPDAETANDARYWFAFTLLARHNYDDAAQNFITYLERAPNGPRAPDAQMYLGMALIAKGREDENAAAVRQGCLALTSLTRRYPNAPRHIRDRAAGEARAASCS